MEQREIKFRAWSEYNYNFGYSDKNGLAAFFEAIKQGEAVGHKFAIQQFTGLKDKNGREIYEGDVVRGGGSESNVKAVVEFNLGCFVGRYTDAPPDKGSITPSALRFFLPQYIVIGNIYENPALLSV
jgi:hypothetical protein